MMTTAAGAGVVITHETAHAQAAAQVEFSVPAGPLAAALTAFGRQAGLQITYLSATASGKTSPGFRGRATRDQALAQILQGAGLTYSFPNGTTAAISDPNAGLTGGSGTGGDAIQLETIDVSGGVRPGDAPYKSPGSDVFLSAEDIARVPPSTAADMFKNTPGVISSMSRNGAAINVNIRGIQGMGRVKTTVDGASGTTSTYRGYYGVDDRSYVDPDFIGGMTIEKGPSNNAQSSGAVGGVVAITTVDADDILTDHASYGVRVRGSFMDNMVSPSLGLSEERTDADGLFSLDNGAGSIVGAARSETVEAVVGFSRRKQGNYFAGKHGSETVSYPSERVELSPVKPGEEVFNTSQDLTSALAKMKVSLGDHTFEAGYIYYQNDYGEITPRLITANAAAGNLYQQIPLTDTKVQNLNSSYRYDPAGNDLLDVKLNLSALFIDETSRYGATADATLPLRSLSDNYAASLSNTSRIDTTFGEFEIVAGGSFSVERARPYDEDDLMSVYNLVWGRRETAALFANGEWRPTDWLTIAGGVRYDTFNTEALAKDSPFAATYPFLALYPDHEGDSFSPNLSVTVEPWDGIQFFGKYAEGVRFPSLREVTWNFSTFEPKPGLKPERARNFEAGMNVLRTSVLNDNDALKLKVAYFDTSYENYISRQYINWRYHLTNIDDVYVNGVEGAVDYDVGSVFAKLSATYYNDVHYCGDEVGCDVMNNDYSVAFIPPKFSVSAVLGARFLEDALTVGTRIVHNGKRAGEYIPGGLIPAVLWNPYTLVDLFASYDVNENMRIDVSAENITDRYYIDALGNAPLPGPGRTFKASFTAKF